MWRTGQVVRSLAGHSSNITDLAWAPRQPWLASCSLDNTVIVWHATGFQALQRLHHGSFVKGLAWDPLGTYLASQSDDKTTAIW